MCGVESGLFTSIAPVAKSLQPLQIPADPSRYVARLNYCLRINLLPMARQDESLLARHGRSKWEWELFP